MFLKIVIVCSYLFIVSTEGYYNSDHHGTFPTIDETEYENLNNYNDWFDWNIHTTSDRSQISRHHPHEDHDEPEPNEDVDSFDSWSIVWYIASFGGLIGFFLIVSCSEWCCRKRVRDNQTRQSTVLPSAPTPTLETPPPAYDLFAPPSYESLNSPTNNEKSEYDIYVVPVHALGSLVENNNSQQQQQQQQQQQRQQEENPPSYMSINMQESDSRASRAT